MTREEKLEALKARLRAREGRRGYETNVAALKAEIARLEAQDGN